MLGVRTYISLLNKIKFFKRLLQLTENKVNYNKIDD